LRKIKHNFKFKELDAAALTRSMQDLDLAVINVNYALPAGLNPSKDALFVEKAENPYINIFVTRSANLKDPRIAKLQKIYQSPKTKNSFWSILKVLFFPLGNKNVFI
jgi:D-methionine transport system substrate-binding protein